MINLDEQLRATLARHAHDAPPAGTPLLDAVHARSRRNALRRRASVLGVVAAVAGITLATVPLATGSHGGASPPAHTATPAPVAGNPATTVPFRVTFIPPGFYPQVWPSVLNGQASLRIESPDPDTQIWIYLRNASELLPSYPPGHLVTRIVGTTRIQVSLDGSLPLDVLNRVAAGVELAPAQTPVRFPYRLSYLPPNLRVTAATAVFQHLSRSYDGAGRPSPTEHLNPPAGGSLLGLDGPGSDPNENPHTNTMDIQVRRVDPKYNRPDTVYAGHPAHVLGNGSFVQLFGLYPGHFVEFDLKDSSISKQQLERVIRGFRPIPDITDWDSWIVDPLPH